MSEPSIDRAKGLGTVHQTSAGGVACRSVNESLEVVIIRTAAEGFWQLPKGIIDEGETAEIAAVREVKEEAGIDCELIEPIETIEYWFVADFDGSRKKYHKTVHFYLMQYLSGDTADHDSEVLEAKWVPVDEAVATLQFDGERSVMKRARDQILPHRGLKRD